MFACIFILIYIYIERYLFLYLFFIFLVKITSNWISKNPNFSVLLKYGFCMKCDIFMASLFHACLILGETERVKLFKAC